MYSRWQRALPAWIRLICVELPGRGSRFAEPFVTDFNVLVEQLCQEHDVPLSARYALFGHSMGALLAYAMAMRWSQLGRPSPQVLLVSGSPAPGLRDRNDLLGKDSDAALVADLRKHGGTPDDIFESEELLRLTVATLRADYQLCASYRHRPNEPLLCPIHVLAGRQDAIESHRLLAWKEETADGFSAHWFSGGPLLRTPGGSGGTQRVGAYTPRAHCGGRPCPGSRRLNPRTRCARRARAAGRRHEGRQFAQRA